ncbi:SprT-like domain-containing protein [Nocardioides sp.]|uniref:SprT-like domain-containing protein n=1 Tax=Nocardioides sp. TaxID=35761 RepID=UPI0025D85924|nr:SprT-like domain-containing protein [Nocardioides sp.]
MELEAARRLGRELLDEHGLGDWTLIFDRAKRRAGICRYATRQIGLSAPLTSLHAEADVRDTILHEIAHALVGPRHGHDAVWRRTAVRIGCSGQRCTDPALPSVEGDWVGTCAAGHRITRHRRPVRPGSCAECSPRFSVDTLLTWTYRGEPAVMTAQYRAELARALTRAREPEPVADLVQQVAGVRPGDRLQVVAPGSKYDGETGTLVKRGRTRYHLRVGGAVLTVPFALARPA